MMHAPPRRTTLGMRLGALLFMLCASVYLGTVPGHLLFPDDEIVLQTAASVWNRGEWAIAGIDKRTGEPKDRPSGTFGWAIGVDGHRYGIFGHGTSVVAAPLYAAGRQLAAVVPDAWRHAVRSDHYVYHRRSQQADWTRLVASTTHSFVTAAAASTLAAWLCVLGFTTVVAVATALAYAFGTLAWPYAGTLLSEPLSALMLLAAAWAIAHHHRQWACTRNPRRVGWLWFAGLCSGLSVHVHVVNLIALPCLLGYALVPMHRTGTLAAQRWAWLGALGLGMVALALLGLDHWLRFGTPWETGRYHHYAHFVAPWEGLAAFLLAPGRSFLGYSPVILLAVGGWRELRRRHPDAAWFCLAIVVTRAAFVATRSDWWGGWGIGPRHLVAVIPFAVVPLAVVFERVGRYRFEWRVGLALALAACVTLQFHLASHSIFDWMFVLARQGTIDGVDYFTRSHWWPDASPVVGFARLPRTDLLSVQAVLLARQGHPGLAAVFAVIAAMGIGAWIGLVRTLARGRPGEHAPRHGAAP